MKRLWMVTLILVGSSASGYAQKPAGGPTPVHLRQEKRAEIKERWFTIPERRPAIKVDVASQNNQPEPERPQGRAPSLKRLRSRQ